jgi:hypothetical protein
MCRYTVKNMVLVLIPDVSTHTQRNAHESIKNFWLHFLIGFEESAILVVLHYTLLKVRLACTFYTLRLMFLA